jgi:hypothetical protein
VLPLVPIVLGTAMAHRMDDVAIGRRPRATQSVFQRKPAPDAIREPAPHLMRGGCRFA